MFITSQYYPLAIKQLERLMLLNSMIFLLKPPFLWDVQLPCSWLQVSDMVGYIYVYNIYIYINFILMIFPWYSHLSYVMIRPTPKMAQLPQPRSARRGTSSWFGRGRSGACGPASWCGNRRRAWRRGCHGYSRPGSWGCHDVTRLGHRMSRWLGKCPNGIHITQ